MSKLALHDLLDNPGNYQQHETYRSLVLWVYGVRPEMIKFIRAASTFKIDPLMQQGWTPPEALGLLPTDKGRIVCNYFQAEATIHECAHVLWHWRRTHAPFKKLQLAQAVATAVIENDPGASVETYNFLKGYVYGVGGWPGMYASGGRPKNLALLTDSDLPYIIDWEIYAGLCSFTFGRFAKGVRRVPQSLWPYLHDLFTGQTLVDPPYVLK